MSTTIALAGFIGCSLFAVYCFSERIRTQVNTLPQRIRRVDWELASNRWQTRFVNALEKLKHWTPGLRSTQQKQEDEMNEAELAEREAQAAEDEARRLVAAGYRKRITPAPRDAANPKGLSHAQSVKTPFLPSSIMGIIWLTTCFLGWLGLSASFDWNWFWTIIFGLVAIAAYMAPKLGLDSDKPRVPADRQTCPTRMPNF